MVRKRERIFCVACHRLTFYFRIDRDTAIFYLRVWDIYAKRKVDQQIPAYSVLPETFFSRVVIAVADSKVIIAPPPNGYSYPLFVWDLSSNHIHEIGSFSNLWLCHLDPVENVLVAFQIDLDKQPPEVQQTKWKITTRQLLAKKKFTLPVPANCPFEPCFLLGYTNRTYGRITVSQDIVESHSNTTMRLEYDYVADWLTVRRGFRDEPIGHEKYERCANLTRHLTYRTTWRGNQLAIYNAMTGKVTLHQIPLLDGPENEHRTLLNLKNGQRAVYLCGNPEVFVMADQTGAELWFFNPNFIPTLSEIESIYSG